MSSPEAGSSGAQAGPPTPLQQGTLPGPRQTGSTHIVSRKIPIVDFLEVVPIFRALF